MHASIDPPPRLLIISGVCDNSELNLFQGLARSGFEIDLLCDPAEPRQAELAGAGIHVEARHVLHRFDFKSARVVRQKLSARRYDVIYAPFNRGLAAAVLGSRGASVKLVAYRGTMGNLSYLDPGCYVAHLHPRISRILCNCDAVRRYLLAFGFPPERVITIYKGHDVRWYQAAEAIRREELGIPSTAFVVACCANVRPLKGVDVLIRAAARLTEIPLHLLIVGHTPDQRCQRLAQRLGVQERVHFTGFRRDAVRVVRCCDAAVMPSLRREGMPRAIVETLSQGIPAIVSDVGGMPELVQHELNGLVVPPGDVEALSGAILRLYREPELRARLGAAGPTWISKRFSPDVYLSRHCTVFSELAAERRAAAETRV